MPFNLKLAQGDHWHDVPVPAPAEVLRTAAAGRTGSKLEVAPLPVLHSVSLIAIWCNVV